MARSSSGSIGTLDFCAGLLLDDVHQPSAIPIGSFSPRRRRAGPCKAGAHRRGAGVFPDAISPRTAQLGICPSVVLADPEPLDPSIGLSFRRLVFDGKLHYPAHHGEGQIGHAGAVSPILLIIFSAFSAVMIDADLWPCSFETGSSAYR